MKIHIAQTQMTPQNIALKAKEFPNALNWGFGVASFFISLLMLASLVRFLIKNSNN